MPNYGSKIITAGISGLQSQQARIANAGNNIVNVNTPGYSRRIVNLESRASTVAAGGINIGDGVTVSSVLRIADSFLDGAVRTSTSDKFSAQTENEFLNRVEQLFSINGERDSIGSTLTKFFTSFNDLSANPASIELRTNVVEAATDLVNAIKTTFSGIANLQKEADARLGAEVAGINSITAKIADLNEKIRMREGTTGAGSAIDERDQRELLLGQLSEKMSFDRVDVDDGTVTLQLANGFAIVNGGNSRQLEVTSSPSFAGATSPPSLWGGVLSYVVYDYDTGSGRSHLDLSAVLKQGQGSLGALLDLRGVASPSNTNAFQADGRLPEIATRVEALTRTLLTNFNTAYLGPDRDSGTAGHQPSTGDLNGTVPATFGFFDFSYSGAKDTTGTAGLPETSDLDALLTSGAVKNFSSLLTTAFTDPRRVAAARDASSGPPAAAVYSPGDGTNARNMAAFQNTPVATITLASLSVTNITLNDFYDQTVGYVGNLSASAKLSESVASQSLSAAQNRRDSVSAVSLDEEYASLTVYQQAYQASARIIKIADSIFQEIVGLL